ncbi:hypothetical protein O3M35_011662 [Rhynocoris fuscipes]
MPKDGPNCIDFLTVTIFEQNKAFCQPFNVSAPTIRMRLTSTSGGKGGVFSCEITSHRKGSTKPEQIANCACGWTSIQPRIVNGEDAEINEFPSMALLWYRDEQWCGATIIARRAALSAAHCFFNGTPNEYQLIVGEHDLSRSDETHSTVLKVSKIIVHEDATLRGGNDIALVITETDIEYTQSVGPACMPFSINKEDIMGKFVTLAGWGRTGIIESSVKILQKAQVHVVEHSECEKVHSESSDYNPQQHICTYYPNRDACLMDSGGPVYYNDPRNNADTVMGVIVYGKDCGFNPSVHMDVHYYLPWIRQNLPSDLQLCGIS